MILIVDSWAWLALTEEGKMTERCISYLKDNTNQFYTTRLNMYEVYYRIKEKANEEEASSFIEMIKNKAIVLDTSEEVARLAGDIHLKEKFGVVDAFVYAFAIKIGGKVLTGDPHFKGKENVIFID